MFGMLCYGCAGMADNWKSPVYLAYLRELARVNHYQAIIELEPR